MEEILGTIYADIGDSMKKEQVSWFLIHFIYWIHHQNIKSIKKYLT